MRTFAKLVHIVSIGLTLVLSASAASAARPESQPSAVVALIVRGMADARERFSSGVCEVTGRKVFKGPANSPRQERAPAIDGELHGLFAFDDKNKLVRYDMTEPSNSTDTRGLKIRGLTQAARRAAIDALPIRQWNGKLRYVRNEEYRAFWTEGGSNSRSSVNINSPDKAMGGHLAGTYHMFDLRACGIIDYSAFRSGALEQGQSIVSQCLRLDRRADSIREHNGVTTITWETDHGIKTLSVDTRNGYTPLLYDLVSKNGSSSSLSTVKWKPLGDTWVPTIFTIELKLKSGRHDRYECQFEWSHVNETIDRKYFDFRSFPDVWDQVVAIDKRQPDLPTVGEWAGGQFVAAITGGTRAGGLPQASGRARHTMLLWLLVANLLVAVLITVTWVYRARGQRK
jgi:hypothetical protein